jgi:hypothetical protein
MSRIACALRCQANGPHIQQLYTGLSELHRAGQIDLTQEVAAPRIDPLAPQHLRDAWQARATVVVNGRVKVCFDMHDACEVDAIDLASCDVYFKRSYSRQYLAKTLDHAQKVEPYGLNYHVLPDFVDRFALRRAFELPGNLRQRLSWLREALDGPNVTRFFVRQRYLQALPDHAAEPRVLFLVTAYDPYDNPDRSDQKVQERERLNDTRAQCIRLLRKELGPRFLGGFNHNAHASARYRDCLVDDARVTDKRNYLDTLRSFPICVATAGLHGSAGWKLAEYVALSKAIVSEDLLYDVPGDFGPERNYLEFDRPQQCVEQAVRLINDRDLRWALMAANARYYRAHLRPDRIVMNALQRALSRSGARQLA